MLCFVYTAEPPAVEMLPPVFELAMQYELEGLADCTAGKMVEEVSVSNVKAFMNILKPHGATSASTKSAFEALITYLNVKEKRS